MIDLHALQEEENLKVAVEQLAALKPDVLLVERSVGRFAQGLLLEKGIALVLNVKGSLLNRLSRCTGAKVRRFPMHSCSQWLCNCTHLCRSCVASVLGTVLFKKCLWQGTVAYMTGICS